MTSVAWPASLTLLASLAFSQTAPAPDPASVFTKMVPWRLKAGPNWWSSRPL